MIDELVKKIRDFNNPTVVGLDTKISSIPNVLTNNSLKKSGNEIKNVCEVIYKYNKVVIDSIFDIVPAVKIQIAMYEKYGSEGILVYQKTCEYAKRKKMIVIGDIKRGDVKSTAEEYASHLSEVMINGKKYEIWKEDFITINPYLGEDSLDPFVKAAKTNKKGIFVLVKTSNQGSKDFQDLKIKKDPLYLRVAKLTSKIGSDLIGKKGFSSVGAVVGATHKEVGKKLRESFPKMFFLVPGFGAQGGKAEDIEWFFNKNGEGAIINSSRGIIESWKNCKATCKSLKETEKNVSLCIREAAIKMRDELNMIIKKRKNEGKNIK